MKKITIILTGDMGAGKTRFGEALVELLRENGVDSVNVRLRSENGEAHHFQVSSDDALGFAKIRGK